VRFSLPHGGLPQTSPESCPTRPSLSDHGLSPAIVAASSTFVRSVCPASPMHVHDFSAFPMIRIDKPCFALLFPHMRPKLVCFKTIIARTLRLYLACGRFECF
jgi:hypothetical protein